MIRYSYIRCRLLFSRNENKISAIGRSVLKGQVFWGREYSYFLFKREISFFKSPKNDIIKKEFHEILKEEKEAFKNGLHEKEEQPLHVNIEKESKLETKKEWKDKEKIKYQKTRGKFKRLFIFIIFQSIPIVGLMYLFKYLENVKLSELNYSFNTSEDIIKEATKLIDGSCACFCLYYDNNRINTIFVDPLNSENCEKNYQTNQHSNKSEEKEDDGDKVNDSNVKQKREKNSLENIMYTLNKPFMQELVSKKCSVDFPLNYLYFSISKNSDIHKYLKNKNNEISLLYSDEKKNIYATLNGIASIIKNDDIKNVLWTDKWSYIISEDCKENYILVKFTPSLISLKTIGMKDRHWKNNVIIRKTNNNMFEWEKI